MPRGYLVSRRQGANLSIQNVLDTHFSIIRNVLGVNPQGNRILTCQYLNKIVFVPSGLQAFGLDAALARLLMFEKVERHVAHHS